jgi:crotonobetainyl-CoA:carnitine CoA-transferase CaiB-like acyl-CoA transferase
MDYFLTGNVPARNGNRHAELAPHGVYPCENEDWISIAVQTDEEWRALCESMGFPALIADPRFVHAAARREHAAELDELLSTWTRQQNAQTVSESLRARGVAAFKSLNTIDLVSSEHLWGRGFYRHVTDPVRGEVPVVGAPWRMSLTPPSVSHAAPRLGEHNDYVLGELLGLSPAERERLVADKIVH